MKKIISLILALLMLLPIVACSSQPSDTDDDKNGNDSENNSSQGDGSESNGKTDITFGNMPNNIFQSTSSLCFAEDRVFYVREKDYMLCSFKLDGSDFLEHCTITEDTINGAKPCLNYYSGGIYYTVWADVIGEIEPSEIRRYDLKSGEIETVYSVVPEAGAKGARVSTESMLIINDTLCYSYYVHDFSTNDGMIYVDTIDLTTGKAYPLTSSCDSFKFGFDTDGTYLYLIWNGKLATGSSVKRVLLSELYKENPEVENILGRSYYPYSYVLDNNGFYALIKKSSDETIYGFYSHEALAGDKFTLAPEAIATVTYNNNSGTEEATIDNLGFDDGSHYMLKDARVTLDAYDHHLRIFYSKNSDWRESTLVADPEYNNAIYRTRYYGEYNDTLYFVIEDSDGTTSLHFLTADGNYQ